MDREIFCYGSTASVYQVTDMDFGQPIREISESEGTLILIFEDGQERKFDLAFDRRDIIGFVNEFRHFKENDTQSIGIESSNFLVLVLCTMLILLTFFGMQRITSPRVPDKFD